MGNHFTCLINIQKFAEETEYTRTSLTSMLCSSVVKAFFVPKRGTEIDEDLLCQNMSKSRFQKIGLMFAF